MNIKKNLGVKDPVDHWTWYNAAVKLISKENNETITAFFRYWLACFVAPLYHTHQKHGKSLLKQTGPFIRKNRERKE